MSEGEGQEDSTFLTAQQMREWLEQEIRNAEKANELRLREAREFVAAYEKGELSPEGANERLTRYEDRWGEPLHGAIAQPHLTDEQILARMDQVRESRWANSDRFQKRVDEMDRLLRRLGQPGYYGPER